jgi:hypothetical protein
MTRMSDMALGPLVYGTVTQDLGISGLIQNPTFFSHIHAMDNINVDIHTRSFLAKRHFLSSSTFYL